MKQTGNMIRTERFRATAEHRERQRLYAFFSMGSSGNSTERFRAAAERRERQRLYSFFSMISR